MYVGYTTCVFRAVIVTPTEQIGSVEGVDAQIAATTEDRNRTWAAGEKAESEQKFINATGGWAERGAHGRGTSRPMLFGIT